MVALEIRCRLPVSSLQFSPNLKRSTKVILRSMRNLFWLMSFLFYRSQVWCGPHLDEVASSGSHGGVSADGHAQRQSTLHLLAVCKVGRQVIAHLAPTQRASTHQENAFVLLQKPHMQETAKVQSGIEGARRAHLSGADLREPRVRLLLCHVAAHHRQHACTDRLYEIYI